MQTDQQVPQTFSHVAPETDEVFSLTANEAVRMHHPVQGAEHILLGLLKQGSGPAYDVLISFGITYEKVWAIVRHMHTAQIGKRLNEKYTVLAIAVIKTAIMIAQQDPTATDAEPRHLLTSLLVTTDINIEQLFDSLRVDRTEMLVKVTDPSMLAKY